MGELKLNEIIDDVNNLRQDIERVKRDAIEYEKQIKKYEQHSKFVGGVLLISTFIIFILLMLDIILQFI